MFTIVFGIISQTVLSCQELLTNPTGLEPGVYPESITSDCLLDLAKAGNWTLLEHLLDSPVKEADVTEVLDLLTKHKKTLVMINSLLSIPDNVQKANASFRWAQSLTHVQLEVRFSHRIDSAGCVDVFELEYKVTDKELKVSGKCLLSGHKIWFRTGFKFFKDVEGEEAEVDKGVQGRIGFKLKKKMSPDVWKTVYSGEKPSGMSVWHEVQEGHQRAIDKFKRKNEL